MAESMEFSWNVNDVNDEQDYEMDWKAEFDPAFLRVCFAIKSIFDDKTKETRRCILK